MNSLFSLAAGLVGLTIPDGAYEQPCQAGYQRVERFAGEDATYLEKNFADAACEELSLEIRSYGRVTYGQNSYEEGGLAPAGAIDFQFVRVTLSPAQEWVADLYRERKLCGLGDWRRGQETEITGRFCDFFGVGRFAQVPEAGETRYGIYRMDEEGRLYFGKLHPERDGRAPERRPQEFDPVPYIRR